MSVSERVRAALAALASVVVVGCSLIADFDASKLNSAGTGGHHAGNGGAATGGAPATGGASGTGGDATGGDDGHGGAIDDSGGAGPLLDASTNASGGAGAVAGSGGRDAGSPPPACDMKTNTGCAADELCCALGNGVTCRKTSAKECASCGVACAAGLTASCLDRTCVCAAGSERACSGKEGERFCVSGPPAVCAECRDSSDCAGRADGKTRCVGGQCAVCDPSQANAGCSGKTPICDAEKHTCKACTTSPDDCVKPLVCTTGGACGSCAKAADCATATSPICDPTTTVCRPCASNAECVAGPKVPYCIGQTCSACNPSTEAGCTDPTKPDCRENSTGGYSCQACTNDGNCANRPGTTVCDTGSGRCVACSVDNDCGGSAKAPFCVNNTCTACDTSSPIALLTDLRCALKAGGQPVCIRTGTQKGQCGACDPDGARGCNNSQLCCQGQTGPACVRTSVAQCTACGAPACDALLSSTCSNRSCGCGSGAACSGAGTSRFCLASSGSCVECRTDVDCTNPASPLCEGNQCVGCNAAASSSARCAAKTAATVCATTGALQGRCASCDPATNAGCTSATLNQCDPTTATCVDCIDNSGCSGSLDRCNIAAKKCVDCDSTGGCADVPATPICAVNACRACATDAECAALMGSTAPLCGVTGACIPDPPCTSNAGCADAAHPVCSGLRADGGGVGHCRLCDPATSAGCVASQICTANFVCTN